MNCKKCGAKLSKESMFCDKCGTKISDHGTIDVNTDTTNNKMVNKKSHKKILFILIAVIFIITGVSFRIINSPLKNEVKDTLDTIFLTSPAGFSGSLQGTIDDYFSNDKDKSEIKNYLVNYVFEKSDGFFNADTKVNLLYSTSDTVKDDSEYQNDEKYYTALEYCINKIHETYPENKKGTDLFNKCTAIDSKAKTDELASITTMVENQAGHSVGSTIIPAIGMTSSEVLNSTWGKPDSINTTTTANGVSEQWVYGNMSYLYFVRGILTDIQN